MCVSNHTEISNEVADQKVSDGDRDEMVTSHLIKKCKIAGRLVNVVSHCAIAGLPGLSVYGATKAALLNWNDTLRIEQSKYGVKVISFIPGMYYHTAFTSSSMY